MKCKKVMKTLMSKKEAEKIIKAIKDDIARLFCIYFEER